MHSPKSLEPLRLQILKTFSPVLASLSKALPLVKDSVHTLEHWTQQKQTLKALRHENADLLKWKTLAHHLRSENQRLRQILKLSPLSQTTVITAQVVGHGGDAFSRVLLINAGHNQGIQKGQAVISHEGLIGRILRVSAHTAQVLLIQDISSRIPALLESTGERTIIAGTNGPLMEALYLPKNEKIIKGERVVSSFEGGVFPPNIVIGKVIKSEAGTLRIKSLVNWDCLDFVQIMLHPSPPPEEEKIVSGPSPSHAFHS